MRQKPVCAQSLEEAFDALFHAYHAVIVSAALNRLQDPGLAQDAAAEVFLIALRKRDDHVRVFKLPWLYQTLRNVVGNEYRRHGNMERKGARVTAELIVHQQAPDDLYKHFELRQLIARLPYHERELLWMAYWEDLSHEEIAEILECSKTALRVRLLRARNRIKALMTANTR